MGRVQKREKGIKMRGWEEPSLAPKPKILSKRCHSPNSLSVLLKKHVFLLIYKDCSRRVLVFASLRSLSQDHLFMKNKWAFIAESG